MNISQSFSATVSSISFSFLTTEDVRRISVKQIVNPNLLDELNRPNVGGLYDPSLGPSDKQDMYVNALCAGTRADLLKVVQHADYRTSLVPVTLVTLNFLPRCTIPFLWGRCMTYFAEPVSSAINSRRIATWCVHSAASLTNRLSHVHEDVQIRRKASTARARPFDSCKNA